MKDITPTLKVGSLEEAEKATFAVTFCQSALRAAETIDSGRCAMVPTKEVAYQVLKMIGTSDEQIEYLMSGHPREISLD